MDAAFYWLGFAVTCALVFLAVCWVLLWCYFRALHGRFGIILFRPTARRLSIASWYGARLLQDDYWSADDWSVCERPLYLSYRLFGRRVFVLAGTIPDQPRSLVIRGDHPAMDPPPPY